MSIAACIVLLILFFIAGVCELIESSLDSRRKRKQKERIHKSYMKMIREGRWNKC